MDKSIINRYGMKNDKIGISEGERLRREIHEHHLSYLGRDDTPEKLDCKTKLESLIVQYLSIAPHSQKFSHNEVLNCFNRTLANNQNVSAYRVANAFEILEKYAINLLTKPWRKEFTIIYPYSGYYKQMIDRDLIDSKYILFSMGYEQKQVPQTIFRLTEAPLDPDQLASIALDCLIAFVECQIIIQVRDALKRKEINTTYFDIYDIRIRYVCGMDDVVRFVSSLNKAKLISREEGLIPLSSKYSRNSSHENYLNGYHHTSCHLQRRPSQLKGNHSNGNYPTFDSPTTIIHPASINNRSSIPYVNSLSESLVKPPHLFASNYPAIKYYNSNNQMDFELNRPNLDIQVVKTKSADSKSYSKPNSLKTSHSQSFDQEPLNESKKKEKSIKAITDDLRDIPINLQSKESKLKTTISIQDPNPKLMSGLKGDDNDAILNKDVVDCPPIPPKTISNGSKINKWSCSTCTYLNAKEKEICEICSRSKESGPESSPLVSGGKECPVCTLVNDKNVDFCTVCETSLADSPTYI